MKVRCVSWNCFSNPHHNKLMFPFPRMPVATLVALQGASTEPVGSCWAGEAGELRAVLPLPEQASYRDIGRECGAVLTRGYCCCPGDSTSPWPFDKSAEQLPNPWRPLLLPAQPACDRLLHTCNTTQPVTTSLSIIETGHSGPHLTAVTNLPPAPDSNAVETSGAGAHTSQ